MSGRRVLCFQFLIRRESMSGLTFDESFTFDEDAELASRYFRKKVKCAYSAKCFYAVRLHSHSLTASYKNSNLNCAFSLPLYFFRCSHGLRAGLRRTYRRYSVMLYYRALVMMSEGKYYDDRSTIIKALNLDTVHSKTVSVMFKCWIFTRHFICIMASPKVGASLIRFKKNFRPHKGKDISKVNYTGRES